MIGAFYKLSKISSVIGYKSFRQLLNEWGYPHNKSSLTGGSQQILRWQISPPLKGMGRLEWLDLLDSNQNWQLITNTLEIGDEFYSWTVPKITTYAKLRITSDDIQLESPAFGILENDELNTLNYCDDNAYLSWSVSSNATKYNIYELGEKYMEYLGSTRDTFLLLNNSMSKSRYISVFPVIKDNELRASYTYRIDDNLRCYFKNFYALKYIADKPELALELNTNYQIAKIVIERKVNDQFQFIETLTPQNSLSYFLLKIKIQLMGLTYTDALY